jgi:mono/diheme cytochrome c family protein
MRFRARSILAFAIALVAAVQLNARAEPISAADAEFFEKEIRPLLIQHCHKCHGDSAEPKGGLTLTSRAAILKGGESGPAAVAGKPQESRLIAAINHDGLEMPPDSEKLEPAQIARLTRWVERGLLWPENDPESLKRAKHAAIGAQVAAARRDFWSFQPVQNPTPPAVKNADWVKTSIDRFVLAELEARGLSPSPPADKRTLLRRLSFDLVGLPPTPEEFDDFLADKSAEATARVVDHLLASPRYGERWGRHWLDVARYADTKGYVLFQDANFPWSYTYRDYVVRALNDDLPYDRFVLEQLAADLLPLETDKRPLTALGFLTLGSGFMNNQQDVIDDRIDVVTRGLLGLTVTCARCHDHKFDPIPTEDYYSLYGVLASAVEPTVPPLFEEPPRTEAYAAFAKELDERQRKLNEYLDQKYRELISGARTRAGEYLLAAQALEGKPSTGEFMLLADGNDLNPTMIIRYQTYLERTAAGHDPVLAVWHRLAALVPADFAAKSSETVEQLVANQTADKPINSLVAGAFLGKPLKDMNDVSRIYGELLSGAGRIWQAESDRAKSASSEPPKTLADANLEALRKVLWGADCPACVARNEFNELALLPDRPAQDIRNKLVKAIEEWRASGPAAPPRAMALEELPTPIAPRVFVRGNSNQLGEEVPRRFLRVLCDGQPAPFPHGSGRLDLARAIVDRDNPLTARVLVNRVWLDHFGSALVGTPSDFGLRSEKPTHPALLDYLAWNFVERGWSIKKLHREIVLSAVYQQASADRAECRQIDPENTWLWKMNRRRLDFEATRDSLLSVAGRLESTLGGPPVKEINEPTTTRRAIYGYIDRLNLPGVFRTFDFPNPDATSPQRVPTTVPQQALFFMNSPLVIASARHVLARADVAALADPRARICRLYRVTLGRDPSAEEVEWAKSFIDNAAASEGGWNQLSQGLLSANEFVFID